MSNNKTKETFAFSIVSASFRKMQRKMLLNVRKRFISKKCNNERRVCTVLKMLALCRLHQTTRLNVRIVLKKKMYACLNLTTHESTKFFLNKTVGFS